MKILSTSLLLLALNLGPFAATSSVAATADEGMTALAPESEAMTIVELTDQPQAASAVDLSLFGVISLGIIGLFWIRRHTSQL